MTDNNERREWTDEELVPLASLNQYCYCPLRCYYIYVAEEFEDNVHTLQGTIIHERVHQVSQHKVGEKLEVRGIYLFSRRYGIIGKADLIEIDQEVFIPVEYKKGRRGDWLNDQVQFALRLWHWRMLLVKMLSMDICIMPPVDAAIGSSSLRN